MILKNTFHISALYCFLKLLNFCKEKIILAHTGSTPCRALSISNRDLLSFTQPNLFIHLKYIFIKKIVYGKKLM